MNKVKKVKAESLKCVRVLVPALIETKEQQEATDRCMKSLVSMEHCVKTDIDFKPYYYRVAGVWNAFLDNYRGKEYDYLLIVANDIEADPLAIDYMVRCLEENPNAGIVSGRIERNYETFKKNYGQHPYTGILTHSPMMFDAACLLFRKGVVEQVGRIDQWFPIEFVERDYIYRAKLAGYDWVQPDVPLFYHPEHSLTVGNDDNRLRAALRKYIAKWGGDANYEQYLHPFNNLSLDYTHCMK